MSPLDSPPVLSLGRVLGPLLVLPLPLTHTTRRIHVPPLPLTIGIISTGLIPCHQPLGHAPYW